MTALALVPPAPRTVDDLLAQARSRLRRLTPLDARAAVAAGALLVDVRPQARRAAEGDVPGALVVERADLEFRFDPASPSRLPQASYDLQVVLLCSSGATSSLAAAALHELGLHRATDVVGGLAAWREAGLPVQRRAEPPPLTVDAGRLEVRVHGEPVDVTPRQVRFLVALDQVGGRVLSRAAAASVIGVEDPDSRALDVLACRLRKRLGPDVSRRLVTVRGVGYRLLV